MDAVTLIALLFGIGAIGYFFFGSNVVNAAGGSSSGNLNASQIAMYASNAGFVGADLVTAVAIALAESSGNPQAVGDSGTSLGLWQIHFTVHPEFDKTQLFDPQYNAQAAFALYTARINRGDDGFSDWSTYTQEVGGVLPYSKYLDTAAAAVSA